MHHRVFRDSFVGRTIYHLSGHKYFSHIEEDPNYVIPDKYLPGLKQKPLKEQDQDQEYEDKDKDKDNECGEGEGDEENKKTTSNASNDTLTENDNDTDNDNDGLIIVDWDGDDDQENPLNWSLAQKTFFILQISFLTTSVYMGSAVYTPGIEQLRADLNVGRVVATLPLTLFVIGYGIGPMIFSPMSENAIFGRTSIYIVTLTIFVILQVPTALVKNIAGLCIVRFLGGIFASPCLATGAASVADVVHFYNGPLAISVWSLGAVCGPSLGPFFGSILTVKGGWRWTFWFMCILSGFSLAVLSFSLPETFSKTLLRRKAQRLRARTGNEKIVSEGEIENRNMTSREMAIDILWRPFEITFTEPVVILINIYVALVYSILYIFFEVFPIFYVDVKGFTLVELGCSFFSVLVGVCISCGIYLPIIKRLFTDRVLRGEEVFPEVFIPLAIVGGCLLTGGLFIFGWAGARNVPWIAATIGAATAAGGGFIIFQTLFNYMGASFKPIYIASVFASNDLFRSIIASVFPLFGAPLFNNLATPNFPVGWGSSVLGFITLIMIAIPILFYLNGPKLRARSKYAIT